MPKHLWVQDAGDEEQGSFSDRESRHTYDNVSDLTKADAVNNARASGDEVVHIDDPIDGSSRSGGIDQGQRHNVYYSEQDDQGQNSPRKHEPGR